MASELSAPKSAQSSRTPRPRKVTASPVSSAHPVSSSPSTSSSTPLLNNNHPEEEIPAWRHQDPFSGELLSRPSFIAQVRDLVLRMQAAPELLERLRIMVDTLCEEHGYRAAAVMGFVEVGHKVHVLAERGVSPEEHEITTWWAAAAAKRFARGMASKSVSRWVNQPNVLPHNDQGIMLPLRGHDRLVGVLALFDDRAIHRIRHEWDFLSLLAMVASLFVEQSRYQEEAQTSRNARLFQIETLVESGQSLTSSLGVEQVCENVLALTRRLLSARAGWIMLHHHEDDTLRMVSYSGLGRERLSGISFRTDHGVAGRVFRSRHSAFVADVQKEGDFAYPEVATRSGLRAMLAVPLLVRSEAIGVLGVFLPETPRDQREKTAQQELAEIFAGQAAAAIQNVRLYQRLEQAYVRDRRIAETLQHVLLSDVPPSSPGLEIGHTYRAALDEAVVGGDFYDVFNVGGGRVALVIGDVSGKGLSAAVQTARVKFGLRAFASEDPRPDQVVRRLHQSIVQQGHYEGFVTLFFGVFDPNTGILEYANSGHEPPLLHRNDHEVEWLARTGTVLGLDLPNSMEFGLETRRIHTGDHLVLYTDGLTEARQNGRFLGREGLLAAWTKVAHLPPERSANELYESIQRFAKGRLTDDVAVLVAEFVQPEPMDASPFGSVPLGNGMFAGVGSS